MTAPARLLGPPLEPPKHATINRALAQAAELYGPEVVLVDAREVETHVPLFALYSSARIIASALASLGVRRGDRVAIVLPTGRDFLDAFFGAQLAGAVPVPLYPPVRLGRMAEYVRSTARMLGAVGAKVVLSDRTVRLLLGEAVAAARPPLGCCTVADLRAHTGELALDVAPGELAVIQFSSGSTVDPKPVALTHANLVAQCAALRQVLVRDETFPVGVSWLPLYHDMGLIGCLLAAVTFPGRLVLLPPELFLTRPASWLRAISRHRATISPAPNFAFGLCVKRARDEELEGVDLSCWRAALNGAEPVSAAVMSGFTERFSRFGFRRDALCPVYGLSEASLAVTFTPPGQAGRVLGVDPVVIAREGRVREGARSIASVGVAVPGASIEVRDEDGSTLPERSVGRIWARAPFVMHGYFHREDLSAETLRDGWLDTGDLGFVDAGELFVCGRAKDVVVVRGANHAPQEFEECAEGVEGVRAGCVVAVGHVPEGGENEELLLFVEVTNDAPSDLAERLSARVAARTGIRPWRVEQLRPGTLPRTSSGKLRRAETLRRHVEGALDTAGEANVVTLTRAFVRSALAFARVRLG